MKNQLYLLTLICISCIACKNKSTTETETGRVVEATYQNATVYTGSTDYEFQTADGTSIMVRVSNFEDEPQIQMPDGLLENSVELDGPPGANTKVVGQTFKLYYNAEDEVYKVTIK